MAKVNRGMLKELVKECLFEILLESTDQNSSASSLTESRPRTTKKTSKTRKQTSSRPALDSISYSDAREAPPVDTSSITSDPVMAAIFQDTARTTLKEQAAAERGKSISGGDSAARLAREADPTELFGDSSQNWAALAFNEISKS